MGGVAAKSVVAGRYELEMLLGRGGMGEVWRARHTALNTHWAIKFLHSASAQKESARKRFETEAQVTAQLKTRHAVQVFDFGVTDGGQPYLVMELLEGETLGHRLERDGRLPFGTAIRFLSQAARALDRAHALGIVHRDLKPDNLVVVSDEEGREYIKVLDFGIAKLLGELEAEPDESPTSLRLSHHSFTRTGNILGTPYYMAPEQIRDARNIDMRADIWAFGVVAYEVLTGVPPFDGKDIYELFQNIQAGNHTKARELRPRLPASFDLWFEIACSIDPTRRFASAKAAATHLSVALNEPAMPEGSFGGDLNADYGGELGTGDARVVTLDEETLRSGKVLSRRRRRSVGEMASVAPAPTQIKLSGSGVNPTARTLAQSQPPPRPTPPPAPSEAPVPPAVPSPRPVLKPDRRGLQAGAAALAVALVGLVGWAALRGNRTGETQTSLVAGAAVAASPTPVAVAPSDRGAVAVPAASLDESFSGTVASRASASASATAAPPPATPASLHPSAFHASRPARVGPPPPSPAAPSAAPPIAAAAPATSTQKPRPAASGQSPFELPPLGL